MSWINQLEVIKDTLQTAVDSAVTRIEEIHTSIANVPLDQLEKAGGEKLEKLQAKERHEALIHSIYDTIRTVNNRVGDLASDLFEALEDGQQANKIHKENAQLKSLPDETPTGHPGSDKPLVNVVSEDSRESDTAK
ncbi:MAG: hypothetical protein MI864_24445 [Pseudomonadales bacterium]|uniref:Uncharacterized protein n=1 Tax=Oleiphilus messinensis TaxID=141451 RepID=A0A1Y0I7H0_9GAMM|nr:hypothetical protein [Oleiphilus messinensis]ARU55343.1 hypothetical protein OLMES_1261 [Oleiphilus messinensis]MCG8613674.1 hypothetical protein [Pseudomonadales bacterium]